MTLKEFFRKARTGRTWRLVTANPLLGEQVRCELGFCPLGAVAHRFDEAPYWHKIPLVASEIVRNLKLPKGAALKIANAADKPRSRNRKWLLKNLGVGGDRPAL